MNKETKIKTKNLHTTYYILRTTIFVLITTCYMLHATSDVARATSLGIDPPVIRIQATAPANIVVPITLFNNEGSPVTVSPVLKPFTDTAGNGLPDYKVDDTRLPDYQNMFGKIVLTKSESTETQNEITLEPFSKTTSDLHLVIDTSIKESDYYFSIVFVTKSPKAQQTTSSNTTAIGIGTNVLLSVGNAFKPQMSIEEFSSDFLKEKGPVSFALRVKNIGGQLFEPKGSILIHNMFGQLVGQIKLAPVHILSGTTRSVPSLDDKTSSQPTWKEILLLGPYSATVEIQAGSDTPTQRQTIYFVGAPIQIVGGAVLVLCVFLFIKNRIQNRLNNHH